MHLGSQNLAIVGGVARCGIEGLPSLVPKKWEDLRGLPTGSLSLDLRCVPQLRQRAGAEELGAEANARSQLAALSKGTRPRSASQASRSLRALGGGPDPNNCRSKLKIQLNRLAGSLDEARPGPAVNRRGWRHARAARALAHNQAPALSRRGNASRKPFLPTIAGGATHVRLRGRYTDMEPHLVQIVSATSVMGPDWCDEGATGQRLLGCENGLHPRALRGTPYHCNRRPKACRNLSHAACIFLFTNDPVAEHALRANIELHTHPPHPQLQTPDTTCTEKLRGRIAITMRYSNNAQPLSPLRTTGPRRCLLPNFLLSSQQVARSEQAFSGFSRSTRATIKQLQISNTIAEYGDGDAARQTLLGPAGDCT